MDDAKKKQTGELIFTVRNSKNVRHRTKKTVSFKNSTNKNVWIQTLSQILNVYNNICF